MIDTVNHCSKTRCRIVSSVQLAASAAPVNVLKTAEEPGAMAVDIYPNPASGHINIMLQNGQGTMNFMLFDNTGRNVVNESISELLYLDISNLEDGIYFYKIYGDGQDGLNGKVVIQR